MMLLARRLDYFQAAYLITSTWIRCDQQDDARIVEWKHLWLKRGAASTSNVVWQNLAQNSLPLMPYTRGAALVMAKSGLPPEGKGDFARFRIAYRAHVI
jgi:hypothetical protein